MKPLLSVNNYKYGHDAKLKAVCSEFKIVFVIAKFVHRNKQLISELSTYGSC